MRDLPPSCKLHCVKGAALQGRLMFLAMNHGIRAGQAVLPAMAQLPMKPDTALVWATPRSTKTTTGALSWTRHSACRNPQDACCAPSGSFTHGVTWWTQCGGLLLLTCRDYSSSMSGSHLPGICPNFAQQSFLKCACGLPDKLAAWLQHHCLCRAHSKSHHRRRLASRCSAGNQFARYFPVLSR